jgi:hypothetical protein
MVGVPETTDRDLQYHVLPDYPPAALNVSVLECCGLGKVSRPRPGMRLEIFLGRATINGAGVC